ncbi:MAG: ABC transporter ATP-binding protein [Armatimonadota bacterium]|nr:ABC transporter ATP-binding protein [Armatimonadota bacterium]MDR7486354.1 ABC transporter ATP-binding protein [Armatimonadota bacterium]MDR7534231.1 ABC transporter ATP-binding protein [Armatimonadota bacterium]MDR7536753.1 ABC transporter ATP-binding protein [Armatimonadota bacterium]
MRNDGSGSVPSSGALVLHDVSVRYDRVWAIRNVSLEVGPGEIVALIGANGAGKTTTLRAVAGLAVVASGEIHLDGRRIDGLPPDRIAAAGVAMVPEGRHVFPYMSVADNLLMGAFLRRHRQAIRDDLQRVLTRFPRLGERLRQLAGTLSGGEQQMLAIGRALMARPRVLLLDEPSLGLAPQVVREIARTILTINREDGATVVLVEQNAHMALRLSGRAYVLQTGQVALAGRSAELVGNEEVKRLYLGG